ncbi:MAG: hypothetical protein EHM91_11980 [Planctomycetota bacterium]|nr:MAG: hypothetical protein EHM91_11980 [Planctomycetota bacterium]
MRRILAVLLLACSSCVYPNYYLLQYRPMPERTLFEHKGLLFHINGSSPVAEYREPMFDLDEAADHVDFYVTVRNAGKETVQWSTETSELRADRMYRNSNRGVVTLAPSGSTDLWLRFDFDPKKSPPPRFDATLKLGEAVRPSGEREEVVVPLGADLQLRHRGSFPMKRNPFLH